MESKPESDVIKRSFVIFHEGCLSAMMGKKARLKLFKKVVVRRMGF